MSTNEKLSLGIVHSGAYANAVCHSVEVGQSQDKLIESQRDVFYSNADIVKDSTICLADATRQSGIYQANALRAEAGGQIANGGLTLLAVGVADPLLNRGDRKQLKIDQENCTRAQELDRALGDRLVDLEKQKLQPAPNATGVGEQHKPGADQFVKRDPTQVKDHFDEKNKKIVLSDSAKKTINHLDEKEAQQARDNVNLKIKTQALENSRQIVGQNSMRFQWLGQSLGQIATGIAKLTEAYNQEIKAGKDATSQIFQSLQQAGNNAESQTQQTQKNIVDGLSAYYNTLAQLARGA